MKPSAGLLRTAVDVRASGARKWLVAFRPLSTDLWVAERPQSFLGLEIGTRMTVARLASGGLFVHSPVALDTETRGALATLGPVRAVVAPNRYHHLHVGDYLTTYPEARVHAAPGLAEKRRDLRFHATLDDEAPSEWRGEIDQLVFRAMPIFNEVVFCHRASRTLVLTDLAFNMRHASSLPVRVLLELDGVYGRFGHRVGREAPGPRPARSPRGDRPHTHVGLRPDRRRPR